ncbi:glycosyltransferase family 2 protein [Modestobacter sp. SYSU DS0290]
MATGGRLRGDGGCDGARRPGGGALNAAPAPLRVVVVTYSPGAALVSLIDSLAEATVRPVEVVLADNGSTDGVPERVAAAHPHVRLLRTGGNVGYGAAVNAGLADLTGGHALVVNPDVRFGPGSVDELLAVAGRWPRAAVVGPAIHTPDGELYPSARDLPRVSTGVGHALLGRFWPGNPWTVRYRRERESPRERPAGWLSGACALVDVRAFHAVGGFDPGYFMYFEDVDLAERLGRRGWLSVYAPSAVVVHEGGHSTRREPGRMERVHHVSALRYLSGVYAGPRYAPLRVLLRLGLGARLLASHAVARVRPVAVERVGNGREERG